MGLLTALSNAVSGLNVNQQQLNILSQNVANANTAGYSDEIVNEQAAFASGIPEGVTIASITRNSNSFLNAELQSQTSLSSAASVLQSYYSQIESLLGEPGQTSSIDQTITTFFDAIQSQASNPQSSGKTTILNDANSLTQQISGLASSLQGLQVQSDTDISSAISSINQDLQTLHTTNGAIALATATNENTAGLLDQRDNALNDLAQYIDIQPAYQADGEVSVSTTAGANLLDTNSNTVGVLSYTPATSTATFSGNLALSPITVSLVNDAGHAVGASITLATGGTVSAVKTSITGGKLAGLISTRDSVIPNIMTQLNTLAGTLRDQVNAISNSGTSVPPPNSYTGQRLVTGSQTSLYSGSIRLAALTDSNGNAVAIPSPYADEKNGLQPLTLDLSTLNYGNGAGNLSVDNIINAINQYYGPPQNKAELGNINNVQLQVASNTVPAATDPPTLNFNFSLNNISGSNANFYVTGATVLDSSGQVVDSNPTMNTPSLAVTGYSSDGSGNITVSANTTGLTSGETVYLGAPTTSGTVGGIPTSSLTGYFTISNVTGSGFQITPANVPPNTTVTTGSLTDSATLLPPYATVAAGQTISTASNGVMNANLSAYPKSPYYTVEANVATVGSNGAVQTSTISYRVYNNTSNVMNNVIGATSQTGDANIVTPTATNPIITASLVDANGNPLPTTGGAYGSEAGYLKITADNSSQMIALDQLNSKQLGNPGGSPPVAGTNQGLSQYFGLNNFFNVNQPTVSGDTLANSALNLSVNSAIENNASLIPSASLSPTTSSSSSSSGSGASGTSNYTYQIKAGDNSVLETLGALNLGLVNFSAAGDLPATTTSLSSYASQVIADVSANSATATTNQTNAQTLQNSFQSRVETVSGVNLDQEMANTTIYENSYTASTRVITVVSQLFDQLMTIIQ